MAKQVQLLDHTNEQLDAIVKQRKEKAIFPPHVTKTSVIAELINKAYKREFKE